MVDKAAIFTDVLRRNKLRIDGQLPPLDVSKEFRFQVALATEREFRDDIPELTKQFAAEREMIQAQVTADVKIVYGPEFAHTSAGHWTINHETRKRFAAFLREEHGMTDVPEIVPVNPVIYGEGAAAVVVEER